MTTTSIPEPGDVMTQTYNGRPVRLVRIITVNEDLSEALVHVLYGPLRGSRYFVALEALLAGRVLP